MPLASDAQRAAKRGTHERETPHRERRTRGFNPKRRQSEAVFDACTVRRTTYRVARHRTQYPVRGR